MSHGRGDEPPPLDPALLNQVLSEDERDRRHAAQMERALTRARRRHRSLLGIVWGIVLVCALAAIWQLVSTGVVPWSDHR